MERVKILGNVIHFTSLEFLKSCLTVEAKILTMSDVVYKVCRRYI